MIGRNESRGFGVYSNAGLLTGNDITQHTHKEITSLAFELVRGSLCAVRFNKLICRL